MVFAAFRVTNINIVFDSKLSLTELVRFCLGCGLRTRHVLTYILRITMSWTAK